MLSRRGFLALVGLAGLPFHHRPGHAHGPKPTPSPTPTPDLSVYTDTYDPLF